MKNGRWAIYPEHRFLSEEKLRMALSDDIANGECPDADIKPGDEKTLPLDEVCRLLSDGGNVTLSDETNPSDPHLREQAANDAFDAQAEREP